ncbi:UDP-glucose--hexose-1-phosphate uridylyltransferase [Propionispora hippei]|uniref:Galactose-1-phosphate uridylyltransferase n=1 Tax=Propionispora hippei DSM 15287 TaxID=1123003 RepID=A0A1M6LF66_9FIRM|nr:UDP-glucose--hexose-1-phosphate uridylyltransferase [Propionispora hippei]SHJ69822.1 UDPglucose--hexose-1-phosphate uridylyltransferase [Propionispora hippei DSM 15287]
MNIYQAVNELVARAVAVQLITREDTVYARNRILHLLKIDDFQETEGTDSEGSIPELLDFLVGYACDHKLIEDVFDQRDILSSQIMDCFITLPSVINERFYAKFSRNPQEATDYFYALSQYSNYIQTRQIARNINYKAATEYGELDITINLSKPEKNPKDIAREKLMKSSNYPRCLLCVENEGYAGRAGHPARANHRLIRLRLGGEPWYFQYSPYVYYNEHCIVLAGEHRDMKIDRQTMERLLLFVDFMPHYFVGSNADLPIVGGSILSHDHYQGGRYEFAMAKAADEYRFMLRDFPLLESAIVKWPMSVIRLRGEHMADIVSAADHILAKWRAYSDEAAHIRAYTQDTPHNTITPIARKRGKMWELDLVLRNNRTTEEHPMGIFHPHEDVQHIKKENIGLIEVMGLAVLPARLEWELKEVEHFLLGREHRVADYHLAWAEELAQRYKGTVTPDNAEAIVRREVAAKFLRVLEDAGVFKRNEAGMAAFKQFIATLGTEGC